ncbi:MAG: CinA family protein, partial [Geodermatophilales bacterium]|nr:CinA family protein [Geodermatophilales bacterium]
MPVPASADPAAVRLHRALLARGETVAAAESLTAGLFCATLASVPGASNTLRGGVVVYATDLKAVLAGVSRELL